MILQFNLRASDVINDSDIIWQKRVLIGSLLHCILRRRSNWCIACYRGVLFHWARTILPQNVTNLSKLYLLLPVGGVQELFVYHKSH